MAIEAGTNSSPWLKARIPAHVPVVDEPYVLGGQQDELGLQRLIAGLPPLDVFYRSLKPTLFEEDESEELGSLNPDARDQRAEWRFTFDGETYSCTIELHYNLDDFSDEVTSQLDSYWVTLTCERRTFQKTSTLIFKLQVGLTYLKAIARASKTLFFRRNEVLAPVLTDTAQAFALSAQSRAGGSAARPVCAGFSKRNPQRSWQVYKHERDFLKAKMQPYFEKEEAIEQYRKLLNITDYSISVLLVEKVLYDAANLLDGGADPFEVSEDDLGAERRKRLKAKFEAGGGTAGDDPGRRGRPLRRELADPSKPPNAEINRQQQQVKLRLPPELLAEATRHAAEQGVDRNTWIMNAIKAALRPKPH